jgi:hypothetical protein
MSPKYPRTFHLPWSPGGTNDDRRLADVEHLLGETAVFTEKMDGSNVCLEAQNVFARSHGGAPKHPSFDALKALHSTVRNRISTGTQVFAEWCYAKHSIEYTALPSYLLVFGVRTGDEWASWDEVQLWAQELGVPTVPVLGMQTVGNTMSLKAIVEDFASKPSMHGGVREGVVVRVARDFKNAEFSTVVGKWVRANHVQTEDHWSSQEIVRNCLELGRRPV